MPTAAGVLLTFAELRYKFFSRIWDFTLIAEYAMHRLTELTSNIRLILRILGAQVCKRATSEGMNPHELVSKHVETAASIKIPDLSLSTLHIRDTS